MKTDAVLQQEVRDQLKWEPAVPSNGIDVTVKDGVVTLTGEVRSFTEEWNAERAARRVAGVKTLALDLTVTTSGSARRSDSDVARAAREVIEAPADLPRHAIKIQVEAGRVTLTGEVDWPYQRQAAVEAVRALAGVTGVIDEIVLEPNVSVGDVKDQIEAAMRRGAYAEADAISVAVHGAEVTLSGTVRSRSKRDLATQSAWSSPGVRSVVDQLTLVD
jgi:osmotically-inducible protein OsmY